MTDLTRRDSRRRVREQMQVLGFLLIAAPFAAPLLGRDVIDLVAGIPIGLGILAWYRWRPGPGKHLGSVEYVVPDGTYDGPDAITTPFYMPWCDCGWMGDDHASEHEAREEAEAHAPTVRGGLHRFGE